MNFRNPNWDDNSFSPFVGFSVIVHVAVLLFFTIRTVFFPSETIIMPDAIHVDIVALPDKKIAPVQAKKSPPQPKVDISKKKPSKTSLKKIKSQQNKAIDSLKALRALEALKKEKELQQRQRAQQKPDDKLVKGNVLSKGDSLTGLEKIQFNDYFARLKSHLRTHWDLPQWLANANLKAQALVVLDERGYVVRKEIVASSGNSVFDERIMDALESASPFPEPPSRLKDLIGVKGLIFNFPQQ